LKFLLTTWRITPAQSVNIIVNIFLLSALAIKCFVGKDNSSSPLPSIFKDREHLEATQDRLRPRPKFKIEMCGTRKVNERERER
jgi:hypothetical protein